MLVLSRKIGEESVITTPSGDEIRISPMSIRGDRIRIGVTAGVSVKIDRAEVKERIEAEAT